MVTTRRSFTTTASATQQAWDQDEPLYPRQSPDYHNNSFDRESPPHKTVARDGRIKTLKPKKSRPFVPSPPPNEAELARIAQRRIDRAERLERKDLTAQLTPTKTCEYHKI